MANMNIIQFNADKGTVGKIREVLRGVPDQTQEESEISISRHGGR